MGLLAWLADMPGGAGRRRGPPLRWAADAEGGAPYIFKDPKHPDRNVGFEVDLAAALEQELGRRIEFVQYDFSSLVPGLQPRRFRLRHERPGGHARPREGGPLQPALLRLHAATGRPGRRDAVRRRWTSAGRSAAWWARWRTRRPSGCWTNSRSASGSTATRSSRTWTWTGPHRRRAAGSADRRVLRQAQPEAASSSAQPLAEGFYAIAFRKDHEASWPRQFDAALERLADSGQLRRIYEKWGIWNDDQAGPARPSRGRRCAAAGRSGEWDVRATTCRCCCEGPW